MDFVVLVIGRPAEEDATYRTLATIEDVRVEMTDDWEEAQSIIVDKSPQIVLIDGNMLQARGISLIPQIKALRSSLKIYAVSRCPTVELAVGSLKAGADDFFASPSDLIKLRSILKEEIEGWRLKAFGEDFLGKQRSQYDFDSIFGESEEIHKVIQMMKKVILSRTATVLIRGETGTGKGLIARAIHYNTVDGENGRGERPFVDINCTAIPDNLLESELFGYERGAFTDAKSLKKGLFELADGGTIFLDEIGHMNHNLQVKLLKVVEEKRFRRLGGTRDISVDLRIIAGTNQDLEKAMETGLFRKDLYYRLNVFTIKLPLLRERTDDVKLLAHHFLEIYNREHHRQIKGFTEGAIDLMMNYPWPGNVRELRNAIERAVLMVDGNEIRARNLPIQPEVSADTESNGHREPASQIILELNGVGVPLDLAEKRVLEKVLELNRGNKSRAARILEISRPRLLRLIRKYSIET